MSRIVQVLTQAMKKWVSFWQRFVPSDHGLCWRQTYFQDRSESLVEITSSIGEEFDRSGRHFA